MQSEGSAPICSIFIIALTKMYERPDEVLFTVTINSQRMLGKYSGI